MSTTYRIWIQIESEDEDGIFENEGEPNCYAHQFDNLKSAELAQEGILDAACRVT